MVRTGFRRALAIGMGAAAVVIGCSLPACNSRESTPPARPMMSSGDRVARGKYLVSITGCNDCHTPLKMTDKGPMPDMTKYLSGHPYDTKLPPAPKLPDGPWNWTGSATLTAFAGPWGTTYAPNLTPDQNTGMGVWTEEMFIAAMRTGKHFGQGRPIQPPMPWRSVGAMTDEDLKSLFAYLKSVPPVKNLVPDYLPPAPGSK